MKKFNTFFILLLSLLFCLMIDSSYSYGANYIVSHSVQSTDWPAAEWSNFPDPPQCQPCTPKTAMQHAQAGDTVFFRGGEGGNYDVYPNEHWSTPELNPVNSGRKGRPIIFQAFPGELPILKNNYTGCTNDTEGKCTYPIIGSRRKNYIIWDGFQLGLTQNKNIEGNPTVRFDTCKGCALKNCRIFMVDDYNDVYHSNYMGVYIKNSDDVLIKNNYITGGQNMGENRGQSHSSAVLMYTCTNAVIENNTIMETANGIGDKSLGRNNIFRYNFLSRTGTYGLWFGGASGDGSSARGNQAYQNIIVLDNPYARGIKIDNDSTNTGHADDIDIFNNVIYAPQKAKIAIHAENTFHDRYWNNIISGFFSYATVLMDDPNGRPEYMDFNAYNGDQKFVMKRHEPDKAIYHSFNEWRQDGRLEDGKQPEKNGFYGDPGFINPTVHNPNGFKLSKHSPCRQAGKNGEYIGAYPHNNSHPIGCSLSGIYPLLPPKGLTLVED